MKVGVVLAAASVIDVAVGVGVGVLVTVEVTAAIDVDVGVGVSSGEVESDRAAFWCLIASVLTAGAVTTNNTANVIPNSAPIALGDSDRFMAPPFLFPSI